MKVEIQGYCDEKFAAVKDAFRTNFEDDLELGASFAATIDGKFVVDIWGGYADAAMTRSWEKDTIVNVYSTTKVMTSICAHILIDRGQLDPNAPVAEYWPEFAQAGKEAIPVRYVLSHQSGVAGWDEPMTMEEFYDWDHAISMLETQKPWWEPGKHCGYHAITFGHLIGELVRRITGKSLGTFFREEVAGPLNADFHIGFGPEHDHRVAEMIPPPILEPGDPGYVEMPPDSMLVKTLTNPPVTYDCLKERSWRDAEIPAANGHGNARAIARAGAVMACGGELDGVRLMGFETVEKAIEEQIYDTDLCLGIPIRYGLGFGLNSKDTPMGPNPRTFWWGGMGGSAVIMDLDARLSLAYVMNKMAPDMIGDIRSVRLGQAVYESLA